MVGVVVMLWNGEAGELILFRHPLFTMDLCGIVALHDPRHQLFHAQADIDITSLIFLPLL